MAILSSPSLKIYCSERCILEQPTTVVKIINFPLFDWVSLKKENEEKMLQFNMDESLNENSVAGIDDLTILRGW
jgi:hypothetical protein